MRSINLVVIHCSATPNGVWVSPQQIDSWHRDRGFKRDAAYAAKFRSELPHIGYHRLILVDGDQRYGRDLDEIGAHVAGHNANSVGICMVGMDAFFAHQWETLREALCTLALGIADRRRFPVATALYPVPSVSQALELYRAMEVRIVGHRDLSPDLDGDGVIEPREWLKSCPNFDVTSWLARGMEPLEHEVLDGHPAISQPGGASRAVASMRYASP